MIDDLDWRFSWTRQPISSQCIKPAIQSAIGNPNRQSTIDSPNRQSAIVNSNRQSSICSLQSVDKHTYYMRKAIAIAERGRGRTSPNPMVGALVVNDEGVIVGRGRHEVAGGPHAEVNALRDAGERARGATLYCTLEPCSHTGRTGPCAPAVASAGIRRVVIALEDPNPLVNGRGLAYLRERGVETLIGVGREEAERQNEAFLTVMRRQRPLVIVKVALSLDGCIATAPGVRTPLTGPVANRAIQRQRAEVDAIAVGSGTILADDPMLTARGVYRARPLVRVVFDRRLRMLTTARLLSTLDSGPVIIVGSDRGCAEKPGAVEQLSKAGARVITPAGDIGSAIAALREFEVTSVVLEGGATLHAAALQAGIVDVVNAYITPHVLGASGQKWVAPGSFSLGQLEDRRATWLGDDVLVEGHVYRSG
jgi:diaminohydroxyphosphoribosylaminopyrimidine deaminase/5-amino-6-(5-phosphoribosylamino)uracil reductase